MSRLFMGLSADLQQPIGWQLWRQHLKVQASLRRTGQWNYTQLHTHTQQRGELDICCVCVFMHAFLCVWDDQSIQEWVAGRRCVTYNTVQCVCLCAGRWVVAFQRADHLIEFCAAPCYSSHD